MPRDSNDTAWRVLFERHHIPEQVDADGLAYISAPDIRVEREPRLMAKFDHAVNLPAVFVEHGYSILPVARGQYVVGPLDTYQPLEARETDPVYCPLPTWVESLGTGLVESETLMLNSALAAGMLEHFLGERELLATVSGRMGSDSFEFWIDASIRSGVPRSFRIEVEKAQVEVDMGLEGPGQLALIEAKRSLAQDVLLRQLYFPYRTWSPRVSKPVRPVYVVYSNGKYAMWRYEVGDAADYSSMFVADYQEYMVERDEILVDDILAEIGESPGEGAASRTFPQADSFERVVNLLELLRNRPATTIEIHERYAFDLRQANYYTSAAEFLGLAERSGGVGPTRWHLTSEGSRVMASELRRRNVQLAATVLSEAPFRATFEEWMARESAPSREWIASRILEAGYPLSGSTPLRRASTVQSWVSWVIGTVDNLSRS